MTRCSCQGLRAHHPGLEAMCVHGCEQAQWTSEPGRYGEAPTPPPSTRILSLCEKESRWLVISDPYKLRIFKLKFKTLNLFEN